MDQRERGIRRELRRAGLPRHAIGRTARRMAGRAEVGDLFSRRARLAGDPAAARAAQQGAAMGEAFALGMLDAGRWISAGLDRLQAHVNGRGA